MAAQVLGASKPTPVTMPAAMTESGSIVRGRGQPNLGRSLATRVGYVPILVILTTGAAAAREASRSMLHSMTHSL